jgi:hypothetical protein
MRYFSALVAAGALAALSSVVCGYFADIRTGFSQGELKIIPWIVFIITLVSISKGGTQPKPRAPQDKEGATSQTSEEVDRPETR